MFIAAGHGRRQSQQEIGVTCTLFASISIQGSMDFKTIIDASKVTREMKLFVHVYIDEVEDGSDVVKNEF